MLIVGKCWLRRLSSTTVKIALELLHFAAEELLFQESPRVNEQEESVIRQEGLELKTVDYGPFRQDIILLLRCRLYENVDFRKERILDVSTPFFAICFLIILGLDAVLDRRDRHLPRGLNCLSHGI